MGPGRAPRRLRRTVGRDSELCRHRARRRPPGRGAGRGRRGRPQPDRDRGPVPPDHHRRPLAWRVRGRRLRIATRPSPPEARAAAPRGHRHPAATGVSPARERRAAGRSGRYTPPESRGDLPGRGTPQEGADGARASQDDGAPMTEEQPAAAAPTGPPPSMFAVFRNRDFRFLWTGQLVSTIGSSLTDLAAGILIFQRTQSALAVGLMLMATAIPSLVVGLVAGVFVDRYSRKQIMIPSDLIRSVLVFSIPFLIQINIVLLYVVVILASSVKQFFDPAEQSVLPDVATEEELAAANAFLSISSFGSTAIGFAAAGFLAATGEIAIAF